MATHPMLFSVRGAPRRSKVGPVNAEPAHSVRPVSCLNCGRTMQNDSPAETLAWAVEMRGDRRAWLCPSCARAHVRDIESKLPTEHWM
jgi:hypothetical protein